MWTQTEIKNSISYKIKNYTKEYTQSSTLAFFGFEIANIDLRLRGPGNMMGTKQSGLLELRFVNLAEDYDLIKKTRSVALSIIENDPKLIHLENKNISYHLNKSIKSNINWSRIS